MTFSELTQRLGRADFLDGVGIYIGPRDMALASVTKRFLKVSLKDAATYELPGVDHYFHGRLNELRGVLEKALGEAAAALPGR